jgi:hypothetical protein
MIPQSPAIHPPAGNASPGLKYARVLFESIDALYRMFQYDSFRPHTGPRPGADSLLRSLPRTRGAKILPLR